MGHATFKKLGLAPKKTERNPRGGVEYLYEGRIIEELARKREGKK